MTVELSGIKGFLFDLDGVVVDTTTYHFQAWRRMAKELGFDFSFEKFRLLQGMSRMACLEKILDWGGLYLTEAEKLYWSDVKNTWYVELIAEMQPGEVLPGVLPFLEESRAEGLSIALISSSKNTKTVLRSTQLECFFDVVVDGTMIKRSKPDPERYKLAADLLGLCVSDCIVFEDTPQGIIGASQSGCYTIAVGYEVTPENARDSVLNFKDFKPSSIVYQKSSKHLID